MPHKKWRRSEAAGHDGVGTRRMQGCPVVISIRVNEITFLTNPESPAQSLLTVGAVTE